MLGTNHAARGQAAARTLLLGASLLAAAPFLLSSVACAQNAGSGAAVAAASAQKAVPPGGSPVLADPVGALRFSGGAADGAVRRVPVTGQPFAEALRLSTLRRPGTVYGLQVNAPITAAVKKGDVLLATFYVRAVEGQKETGEAKTQFVFEKNGPPHAKSVTLDVDVPRDWRRIDIPFVADADYAAGGAVVSFRMGYDPQTFEVGGLSVLNYGTSLSLRDLPRTRGTYAGQAPDAAWRKEAEARIEKIRKGDLTVQVRDAAGKPVPGATVAVRMTRHAFPFGSAVAAEMLLGEGPDADRYRAFIKENFNRVVLENDLKWAQYEQNPERAREGVAWLRGQGIEVRGHTLVWPGWRWLPKDLPDLKDDKAALAKRVRDHIRQEVTDFRGQLVDWDVVNEPFANHDLMDILGRDAMIEWFKLARQYDPKARLFLNDYPPLDGSAKNNAHLNSFYDNLVYLKQGGAPIDGLGFQGHFGGGVIAPVNVLSGLDRFGKLGLPIAITEFDINTTDEALQADYTRDFLIATFSHPSVDSVIMWGFWEGRHWLPNAAMFTRDWTLKPNGKAWLDLVKGRWWTNAGGTTDRGGAYRTRGFYGDYEVTVTAGGKTKTVPVKLEKDGRPAVVTLP